MVKDVSEVSALRSLQLYLHSNIHALKQLGKDQTTYATKILRPMPSELRKKWTKDATRDSTDLTALLKFLREQTSDLERFQQWEEPTRATIFRTRPNNMLLPPRRCPPLPGATRLHQPTLRKGRSRTTASSAQRTTGSLSSKRSKGGGQTIYSG